jgi:hypothetical protein
MDHKVDMFKQMILSHVYIGSKDDDGPLTYEKLIQIYYEAQSKTAMDPMGQHHKAKLLMASG